MNDEIIKAAEAVKKGGVILYPTDTVWGIGCDATDEEAVDRIYSLKRSHDKHAMTVLVGSANDVGRFVRRIPDIAWELFEVSDKPLTLILPTGCGIAPNLIPDTGTIGIRIPKHDFCQGLLKRMGGRPLVSTSANISGEATPLTFGEVPDEIKQGVDMVVDRSCEGHPTRKPSSIIMLGEGGEVKIIRE